MNETYVVKVGDTLYGISNQFGVSVTELAELNGIKGSNLQIGTVLKIPIKSGTNPSNMFMYTVQKGDNLYGIAKKYNTTVDEIKKLNYLTTNELYIGQVLRIPEMYVSFDGMILPNYVNYVVKKGDNLYSIAKENNITVDELKSDNGLTSNNLYIGQNLKIRIPSDNEEFLECFGEDYVVPDNTVNYTVQKGDSLYSIARSYNTSVSELTKLNNLTSNNLTIGQILKIPSTSNNTVNYTVKKGDSLYSIARTYNTTVNDIKKKNNLTTNNLYIGQKLII